MPAIQFTGLASGLDTRAVIDAILEAEAATIGLLEEKKFGLEAEVAAFNELDSLLGTLESTILSLSTGSAFSAKTTTTSDEEKLTATASSSAVAGRYEVEVTALATVDRYQSAEVADKDTTALVSSGTETLVLQTASGEPVSIEIGDGTGVNTLNELRDAINEADEGIVATIISTGTGDILNVESEETGTDNDLTVTNGATFTLTEQQNAVDAELTINGIDVVSSSNEVDDAIEGVTLNLLETTGSGSSETITVSNDAGAVTEAIQSFIDAYNAVNSFIQGQFSYDADTGSGGVLAGDSVVRGVQSMLQTTVTQSVDGVSGGLTSLAQLGVDFDGASGALSIDQDTLDEALSTNFEDAERLFLEVGDATNNAVRLLSSTAATEAGTYDIDITTAAAQATATGDATIDSATGVAADDTVTVDYNGTVVDIAIAAGDSAATVVSKLNTGFDDASVGLVASEIDNGDGTSSIRILSEGYGSGISFTIDDAGDNVFGSSATSTGVDVAGRFRVSDTGSGSPGDWVDGVGSGQVLSGAEDEVFEGLSIVVESTNTGDFGSISFSRGVAAQLELSLDAYTDPFDGILAITTENLESSIDGLEEDIADEEERLAALEVQLVNEMAFLEQTINQLQLLQQSLVGL